MGRLPEFDDDTRAVALADVDGDGDLDAVLANWRQNRLYLNDGSGLFTDATTQLPHLADDTLALALGDVDGDGDLDLLFANFGSNRLLLNDGRGGFTESSRSLPRVTDTSLDVALGDVDGDGDLDALVANAGPAQNKLYLNDGQGIFTDATVTGLPAHMDHTLSLALGDVDGDGDLDVIFGNTPVGSNVSGQDRLYRNDGLGVFSDATHLLPRENSGTPALALGDLDGDGDLDAYLADLPCDPLLGCSGAARCRLLRNDGPAGFSDTTSHLLPNQLDASQCLALGDVDDDRDLDVFVANRIDSQGGVTSNRLYTNVSQQIHAPVEARIGQPLDLALWGRPNTSWQMFVASATTRRRVWEFGLLRLEPTLLVTLDSGRIDTTGRGSKQYTVPHSPELIGVELYWQALLAFPVALTNMQKTTLRR